jgi:hypothetical protein
LNELRAPVLLTVVDLSAHYCQYNSYHRRSGSFDYPVSRPLFFYVKKEHIGTIPGIEEYAREFTSDKAFGEEGYLSEKGLIPMPEAEREETKTNVENQTGLKLES